MDQYKNFLDGRWTDALSGGTFEDLNPANRSEVLGVFPRSDHRDIDRAVETVKAYFPTWSEVSVSRRAAVLGRAATMLWEQREEVTKLLTRDSGKLLTESLAELEDGVAVLRCVAEDGCRLAGTLSAGTALRGVRFTVPMPLGVAGVITHWAFPLAGALWRLASALVAGNTVVLKPAEEAPLVATRLLDILLNAGVAPKAISLVHGQREEAGAPLVRHPDVDVMAFAGSTEEAREVSIACAAEQRPLSLEVGERLAAVILDDAEIERAVPALVRAATCLAGQRWRGPAWILTHRKVIKDVAELLAGRLEALRLGDGLLPETEMGPLITDAALKRLHGYTRLAVKEGARVLAGGEGYREGDCKRGFFYLPTLCGDVTSKMRVVQQEHALGLLMLLSPVADLDEALALLNGLRPPCTVVAFTGNAERIQRTIDGVHQGRLFVNPLDEPPDERPWARYPRSSAPGSPITAALEWKSVAIGPAIREAR
jgi:alpha-ketoglutaric semialdehyde dehydrogenase